MAVFLYVFVIVDLMYVICDAFVFFVSVFFFALICFMFPLHGPVCAWGHIGADV